MRVLKTDVITVGKRIREDPGDIEALAEDISKNGLLNPIVVNLNGELIAGERRLLAFRHLGREAIPVRYMDVSSYEKMIALEIAENEQRKDFTPEERVKYGRELEQIEALKARERQATSTGGNNPQLRENFPGAGKIEESPVVQNFAEADETGRARDIVARRVGLGSGRNYEKAKTVVDSAPEPIKDAWNKNEISTHKAYEITKKPLTEEEKIKQWQLEEVRKSDAKIEAEFKLARVVSDFLLSQKIPYGDTVQPEHLAAYYEFANNNRDEVEFVDEQCGMIIAAAERIKTLNAEYRKLRLIK